MSDTWLRDDAGSWTEKSAWSEDRVPGVDDDVDVPSGEAIISKSVGTIASLLTTGPGSVALEKGGTLQVQGNVTNDGGLSVARGALTINGELDNQKTGSVSVSGKGAKLSAGDLQNLGTVSVGGQGVLSIDHSGGSLQGTYKITSGGQLDFTGGGIDGVGTNGSLTVEGSTSKIDLSDLSTIAGTLSLSDGYALSISGDLSVQGAFTLNNADGRHISSDIGGSLTNRGDFSFFGGDHNDQFHVARLDNATAGKINLDGGEATGAKFEIAHGGSNAGTISLYNDITLKVDGHFTDSGTLVCNGGQIEVGGTFIVAGATEGAGVFQLDHGALLEIGANAGRQAVQFNDSGADLQLDAPANAGPIVSDFHAGDILDLRGELVKSVEESGGDTLIVTLRSGSVQEFNFSGDFKGLSHKSDGQGGTDIVGLSHGNGTLEEVSPYPQPSAYYAGETLYHQHLLDLAQNHGGHVDFF